MMPHDDEMTCDEFIAEMERRAGNWEARLPVTCAADMLMIACGLDEPAPIWGGPPGTPDVCVGFVFPMPAMVQ